MALWGAKSLDNLVDMDFSFEVEREKSVIKRLQRFILSFLGNHVCLTRYAVHNIGPFKSGLRALYRSSPSVVADLEQTGNFSTLTDVHATWVM
jgi:hypothetical protein